MWGEGGSAESGRGSRAGAFEFRCWPTAGRAAALRLQLAGGWTRQAEPPRSDIYLLPTTARRRFGSLAKLRDGRVLEIKLWRRSAGRLQYWQHGMRASFPLPARARNALGQALDRPPPPGGSAAILCAALEEGSVRLVTVWKCRQLFARAGSRVELSRVRIAGDRRWSVALDDPDAGRAGVVLARLGLHRLANLHYGLALPAICAAATRPASEDVR